jgi:hypothetical protein
VDWLPPLARRAGSAALDQTGMRRSARDRGWRAPDRPRRRRKRRLLLKLFALAVAALIAGPAAFIGTQCYGSGPPAAALTGPLAEFPAAREESFTFLTLPEWFIVFSSEEYARFIARDAPSAFPYIGSIGQYWSAYDAVCEVTRPNYPFQTGYHVMLGVIGASFTAENVVKGVYENTVGRLTEWLSSRDTPEDQWAARTALEYGAFLHTVPWYQFPFGARLGALWSGTPMWGPHLLRKWERRAALTAEYGFKAGYGWLMGLASSSAYAPEDLKVYAHVEQAPLTIFTQDGIASVKQLSPTSYVITMPRYEAFTNAALALDAAGVRFVSIAGNDELLVSALAPESFRLPASPASVVVTLPIQTEPGRVRLAVRTPLATLTETLAALRAGGATIEHLYDY